MEDYHALRLNTVAALEKKKIHKKKKFSFKHEMHLLPVIKNNNNNNKIPTS